MHPQGHETGERRPNRARALLIVLLGALFFALWMPMYSNYLRPHNDSESDSLVANALLHAAGRDQAPPTLLGCFLPMIPGETAVLLTNTPTEIYFSSYGLQGHFAQVAYRITGGADLFKIARGLRIVYSFLFGLVLMTLVVSFAREFGNVAAAASWLVFALSPYFAFFGRSLHWQGWLIFLPIVFSWVTYQWFLERRKLPLFWTIIGAMVFVRCLVGYEFLSNILLGALARPVYLHWTEAKAIRPIGKAALGGFVGVTLGFVLAFAFHAKMMQPHFESFGASAGHIINRAKDRTSQELNQDDLTLMKGKPPTTFATVRHYSRDYGLFTFPNAFGVVATLGGMLYLAFRSRRSSTDRARAAVIAVAAAGSFSWVVLCWNHMIVSVPYNMIVFYLPLYLFAPALLTASLLGEHRVSEPTPASVQPTAA